MCVHRANSAHSLCDIGNIFWGFPFFWAAPTPVSARLKYAYCEICSVISFSSPGKTRPKGEKRIARFDLTRASLSLLQSVSSTCCLYEQKERETTAPTVSSSFRPITPSTFNRATKKRPVLSKEEKKKGRERNICCHSIHFIDQSSVVLTLCRLLR